LYIADVTLTSVVGALLSSGNTNKATHQETTQETVRREAMYLHEHHTFPFYSSTKIISENFRTLYREAI
jgi:L-ribulose-5-phosphate 3-epimerase UlaE